MLKWYARLALALLAAILYIVHPWGTASADAPQGRAAVVVAMDDAHYVVRTVAFSETTITGYDLLVRSGLGLSAEQGFVCSIAGVGCAYPAQECMCALPRYWAYSHLGAGTWSRSGVGASGYIVSDGAVDGWSWGAQVDLPELAVDDLWDEKRIAPAQPEFLRGADSLGVVVPIQGDADQDGGAVARWQRPDGSHPSQSVVLQRDAAGFQGLLLVPTTLGPWELVVTVSDPDGVNGATIWRYDLYVKGDYAVMVPMVTSQGTVSR